MSADEKKSGRRPQPPHEIPSWSLTGVSGAVEQEKTSGDRYVIRVEGGTIVRIEGRALHTEDGGPEFYVIYDRVTGTSEACKTMAREDVYDEVERLNGRAPARNAVSRGKLHSPRRRVKDGALQLGNVTLPSPTEIYGRLVAFPDTFELLRDLRVSRRALGPDDVQKLIERAIPYQWRVFTDTSALTDTALHRRERQIKEWIDNVSKQLLRKFDIVRARGTWN